MIKILPAIWLIPAVLAAGAPGGGAEERHGSFRTDILPILSKAGCNAGACHGAASGRGGFHLSLLGYDPEEDFWTITREFEGRRIDLDHPEQSLILRKPSLDLDHEGGRKLGHGTDRYERLRRWIADGAPYGAQDLHVTRIAVEPEDLLLRGVGAQAQLRVTADLSDGSQRDVTDLALFNSNDDGMAEVDKTGRVTTRSRGLTSIMIRFSGQVAAARIAVPFSEGEGERDFAARNFIDEEIAAEWTRLGLRPSPPTDDAAFMRRVYLDLTGRLPSAHAVQDWLAAPRSPANREAMVERLLASETFVDYWTFQFADLFLISGKRGSEEATEAYQNWLHEQIARNTPWDEIARALVSAEGDVTRSGPANFLTLANDPRDLAEYTSSILLGTRVACARCHAHPADRWTQDDYYQFSAFFAHVSRQGNVVSDRGRGELDYPKTATAAAPRALGAAEELAPGMDRRTALADWMVAPENPLFARALVNRVWKILLGRGLVEPVDDLRPTNPATHPRLLDRLAREFVAHKFDLRWLIRTMVFSRTYQLSSETTEQNRADDRFFSHAYLKPLPAAVLVDAVGQVTGSPEEFDGAAIGTRAVQLVGAQTPSYALDVLGRCKREKVCEPAGSGGGLAQALHLINGTTINHKLADSRLMQRLADGKSDREVIGDLYLRALCRRPSPEESAYWERMLGDGPRREALEDFVWTLLNCREFAYNH